MDIFKKVFDEAISNQENNCVEYNESCEINWNYVEADMVMDNRLKDYSTKEISDEMNKLADIYDLVRMPDLF